MEKGFVKLPRSIDDLFFSNDPETGWIYIRILLAVSYKSRKVTYRGQVIDLQPFQMVTSRQELAKISGVNESKVRRCLEKLHNHAIIDQRKTNAYSLITILYTGESEKVTSERPADGQETTSERPTPAKHTLLYIERKKEGKNIVDDQNNFFDQVEIINHPICQFIADTLPNVSKVKTQLTDSQAEELEMIYPKQDILDVLMAMENMAGISKKYNSVYLTCLNWLKRNKKNDRSKPKQSLSEALRNW